MTAEEATPRVQAWIVDIDGTLAFMDERRGPFDWLLVGNDRPNLPVVRVIQAMIRAGENIIFLTGRMEQCREQTTRWLASHLPLSIGSPLLMRGDDNFQPDAEFKLAQLRMLQADDVEILGVFDDRDSVVAMWRDNGLTCFQVAPGNF